MSPRPSRPCLLRKPRRLRPQAGFSLPELMVVLAIIMLLTTLAVPRYRKAKQQAEDAAARATLNSVHTAQEAHRITHGIYAPDFKTLTATGGAPVAPDDADTGTGGSGESVMVYHGYIYRLTRTAPDEYTVTAEPVEDRDTRPRYTMDHLGSVTVAGGSGSTVVGGGGVPDKNKDKEPDQGSSPAPPN